MTQEYEYRSRYVQVDDSWKSPDTLETLCNKWAEEGFEIFSVIVPDTRNHRTYRVTAKRRLKNSSGTMSGRKFR